MPAITALQFDTTGWHLVRQTTQQIIWKHGEAHDLLSTEFFAHPTELPFDMNNLEAIKAYHEQYSAQPNEGVVVSADVISLQSLSAVRMILKARNPQMAGLSPQGMTYLGSLMIPLADFSYVIKTQCCEYGTTGLREAGVSLIQQPQTSQPAGNVKVINSAEEWFAEMGKKPVVLSPADDERYDAMFPQHPLSRARAYLKHVEQTINIADEVQTAKRVEARHSYE